MTRFKIGYIDEDPEQVGKYERKLRPDFDVVGYEIPKGTELSDLIKQVYESDIDLLMVDYLMVDKGWLVYNGDAVARAFWDIKPNFPLVIFTQMGEQAFPHVDNPNIIYNKSEVDESGQKFAEKIKKNILLYKSYIERRKDKIKTLLEKKVKEPLSAKERHELLEAQLELRALDKNSNEIPYQLIVDESKVDNLSNLSNEAANFLEGLKKKYEK